MDPGTATAAALVGIGFVGAVLSGMLGIGGAIVLIPLLLHLPPLLGLPPFTMAEVAGMSLVQVLAAASLALGAQQRQGQVDWRAAGPMAAATALGAGAGGLASGRASDAALRAAFVGLALLAVPLMLLPDRGEAAAPAPGTPERPVNGLLGAALAAPVGFVSAMIGAGGAFVMLPVMRTVLGMPTRRAIGTSLALVLVAAALGTAAKAATGQIPWSLAPWLVAGAVAGAPLGAALGRRASVPLLRRLLAALIAAVALQMLARLLAGAG